MCAGTVRLALVVIARGGAVVTSTMRVVVNPIVATTYPRFVRARFMVLLQPANEAPARHLVPVIVCENAMETDDDNSDNDLSTENQVSAHVSEQCRLVCASECLVGCGGNTGGVMRVGCRLGEHY